MDLKTWALVYEQDLVFLESLTDEERQGWMPLVEGETSLKTCLENIQSVLHHPRFSELLYTDGAEQLELAAALIKDVIEEGTVISD